MLVEMLVWILMAILVEILEWMLLEAEMQMEMLE
jgi:hypothetical protein